MTYGVFENPDELGYVIAEECPDCGGEGLWRHPEFGPQPCMTCMETGLVPHDCGQQGGGTVGAGHD